ncbi:hypothetical protein B0H66DRAFT_640404 [Apodospora peruviana]|uniref:Uncharacterized protein n=1 Tax=Apodospora peruviana TaxID=516989 RepID=A0AAE0HS02_9PEZI|nr:hypothetical protein B0H66DRAFT_614880 [Apodospora peruviana]KAK3319143.1 hypothetical protein B0H66DRAFT_640404 [Apodospora peruviana]
MYKSRFKLVKADDAVHYWLVKHMQNDGVNKQPGGSRNATNVDSMKIERYLSRNPPAFVERLSKKTLGAPPEDAPDHPAVCTSTVGLEIPVDGVTIEAYHPASGWVLPPEGGVAAEWDRMTSPSPEIEGLSDMERDALKEIRGLEIGLELLHEQEDDDDDDDDDDDFLSTPEVETSPGTYLPIPEVHHDVWDALRQDHIRLYGFSPSDPPDLKRLLRTLRPSKRCLVECPRCIISIDAEFPADTNSILSHFRYNHVGRIAFADQQHLKPQLWKIIRDLMNDPKAEEIRRTLSQQCDGTVPGSAAKGNPVKSIVLPSVIRFLYQLRVTFNGQLACISPKCTYNERVEASLYGIQSRFENHHANHILDATTSELNYHLARYEGDINQLLRRASSP